LEYLKGNFEKKLPIFPDKSSMVSRNIFRRCKAYLEAAVWHFKTPNLQWMQALYVIKLPIQAVLREEISRILCTIVKFCGK
jgi:hypothetical protein